MKTITILIILSAAILLTNSFPANAQINITSIDNSLSFTGDPGPTTITITLINTEPFVSEPTQIGFFFSLDSLADPQVDSLIWVVPVPVIGPGDTVIIDTTFDLCGPDLQNFPDYVLNDTTFFITYLIDPGNTMVETNETDNIGLLQPSLVIGCLSGIDEASAYLPLNIYPNPNDGHFIVSFPDGWNGKVEAMIGDMISHSIIYKATLATDQKDFNLSFLPSGLYILRMKYDDRWYVQLVNIEK